MHGLPGSLRFTSTFPFVGRTAERDELASAMSQLSPAHREVLVLTFIQGLSYAETAEVAGVPEGTIKSRLSNAKRALRTILGSDQWQGP